MFLVSTDLSVVSTQFYLSTSRLSFIRLSVSTRLPVFSLRFIAVAIHLSVVSTRLGTVSTRFYSITSRSFYLFLSATRLFFSLLSILRNSAYKYFGSGWVSCYVTWSTILSLYENIRVRENPYSDLFYAVKVTSLLWVLHPAL